MTDRAFRRAFWLGYLVLLAVVVVGISAAVAAPTVTLTASPEQAISPASVTLTWASTESSACTASGGWSGSKAVNGTEVVSDLRTNTSFTLVCASSTGSAEVSWTSPTTNTDGSAIPATGNGSLAGFEIFHAVTAGGVAGATPINVPNKTATSYLLTGLPVGPHYYAAKAYNVAGIRSDLSLAANNTIVLPSATATASVTVNVKPNAPVVTVAQVAKLLIGDRPSLVAGKVPLGTECGEFEAGQWARVDRDDVKLNFWGKLFRNSTIVAKCA